MLNLLTSRQIREADAYTISHNDMSSLDLMESASHAFVREFKLHIPNRDETISIYCGTGNNGGDGLAIARLLKEEGYDRLSVKLVPFPRSTPDFRANLVRLQLTGITLTELSESKGFPADQAVIIIDAILGTGLNKPVAGWLKSLIDHLNKLQKRVFAVDIPSGLPSEGIIDPGESILKAELAISFQRPKINFFFPESASGLEQFKVVPIGLDENYIQKLPGNWKLIGDQDIRQHLKPRKRFSHKGSYGHALIIAGSTETMGAALLCADACLHSGAGLTTACIPQSGLTALNTRSPEIMALVRPEAWSERDLDKYNSIALGPGLGRVPETEKILKNVLALKTSGLILDADALNILSDKPDLLNSLPGMTILTPHLKEFDRMFGEHNSWWDRLETARSKAREFNVVILLKNQYSFIVLPDGDTLINPSGNPAMAVGGMGDILTGMIAGFLAQGYQPVQAAVLACYIHGRAGDELHRTNEMFSIPPRYITAILPEIINIFHS